MPSTAIRYFDYDSATRELRVTFTSGRRYVYAQVPAVIYAGFSQASSRGAFFNAHIRDQFTYRELTGSGADRDGGLGSARR